jgi:hypothetical protein
MAVAARKPTGRGRDAGYPHNPHRTVLLALLTHTVPTLDQGSEATVVSRTRPSQRVAHSSGTVSGAGPTDPSSPWPAAFVRRLRRYYAAARLPAPVHLGLIAHRLLPTVRVLLTSVGRGASRFSRVKFLCIGQKRRSKGRLIRGQGLRSSSPQGQGSSTPQGRDALALTRTACCLPSA